MTKAEQRYILEAPFAHAVDAIQSFLADGMTVVDMALAVQLAAQRQHRQDFLKWLDEHDCAEIAEAERQRKPTE